MDKKLKHYIWLAAAALTICASAAIAATQLKARSNDRTAEARVSDGARTNFPVTIRQPITTPQVFTGQTNFQGQPVAVACSTCHSTTRPNPQTQSAAELDEFHQGMTFAHGSVSCLSCHSAKNYDTLQLANGTHVAFENVMSVCAQCHGPQYRDYRNGSHGGMNGFWDLKSGPRTRNNCVDCHDPHAPAFAAMMPVFKPLPGERHHTAKPPAKH